MTTVVVVCIEPGGGEGGGAYSIGEMHSISCMAVVVWGGSFPTTEAWLALAPWLGDEYQLLFTTTCLL